jgi:hypothetical protein
MLTKPWPGPSEDSPTSSHLGEDQNDGQNPADPSNDVAVCTQVDTAHGDRAGQRAFSAACYLVSVPPAQLVADGKRTADCAWPFLHRGLVQQAVKSTRVIKSKPYGS